MCLAFFVTCYSWVFVQPDTGRRPVDRCRNFKYGHLCGHLYDGCMDDLATERSLDLQDTWLIYVLGLFLTCCLLVFVQPDTCRLPVHDFTGI